MNGWWNVALPVVAFAAGVGVGQWVNARSRLRAVGGERRTMHRHQPWPLRFVYEDAQGAITSRTLDDWKIDAQYIHGYDRLRTGEERTFRRDRIREWLGSSEGLIAASGASTATTPVPAQAEDRPS